MVYTSRMIADNINIDIPEITLLGLFMLSGDNEKSVTAVQIQKWLNNNDDGATYELRDIEVALYNYKTAGYIFDTFRRQDTYPEYAIKMPALGTCRFLITQRYEDLILPVSPIDADVLAPLDKDRLSHKWSIVKAPFVKHCTTTITGDWEIMLSSSVQIDGDSPANNTIQTIRKIQPKDTNAYINVMSNGFNHTEKIIRPKNVVQVSYDIFQIGYYIDVRSLETLIYLSKHYFDVGVLGKSWSVSSSTIWGKENLHLLLQVKD